MDNTEGLLRGWLLRLPRWPRKRAPAKPVAVFYIMQSAALAAQGGLVPTATANILLVKLSPNRELNSIQVALKTFQQA